ncbi:MAG: FAD-dependent thymidylate synthase [Clostridiales bacterium]|nr:FAD-dependent thymidylate synthase [Clostridiales bacterium]
MLNVKLLAHTPEPERVVAAAARLCYSAAGVDALLEKSTPEKDAKFVRMLAGLGHASPIEHASFTFAIEGVSRSLLAQITRHRIASYSVQSQRYVRLDDFHFVIPPEVEADPAAKAAFLQAMEEEGRHYLNIAAALQEKHRKELMAQGLSEQEADKKAEKLANEDARFVLPNACETKMVVTMNARSLQNFFRARCCNRAQWEIRALAEEMYRLLYPVAPALFENMGPGCVCGGCTEGKMSCGKASEMRAKYQALRRELVPEEGQG